MNYIVLILHILGIIPLQIIINRFYNYTIIKRTGALTTTQPIVYKSFSRSLLISYISLTLLCILKVITPAWTIWDAIVIFGLANTWMSLLFISESARRYMIANMVNQNPSLRPEQIISNYNRFHIINLRIKRLIDWKCITLNNDHYKASQGTMLYFAKLIKWWANILGFEWAKEFT
jgi:hypothetical protein